MSLWLRLYTDVLNSEKIQLLPDYLFKFWVNMICVAKEYGGVLPSPKSIAFRMHLTGTLPEALHETFHATLPETFPATFHETLPERYVEHCLERLREHHLIDIDPSGALIPHDWTDHQYSSDSSTDRVRKFRQRKKLAGERPRETFHGTLPKRPRNGKETVQSRADIETLDTTEHLPALEALQDSGRESGEGNGTQPAAPSHPPSQETAAQKLIAQLQANPKYARLNVDREFRKCLTWCKTVDKPLTPIRFGKWLDHCDVSLAPAADGSGPPAPPPTCRTCGDEKQILRPDLPNNGPELVAALQAGTAYVNCPDCTRKPATKQKKPPTVRRKQG